jgi:hypothetical protein
MYPHFIRSLLAPLAVLACSAAHASIPAFEGYAAASDDELDKMRGGFELSFNGMQLVLAFSLEQLTYINGELVSSMKFNPLQLITPNPAAGTAVAGGPAPTGGLDPTATANSTPVETIQTGTTPAATVTTQLVNNQGVITLIQNGTGNTFTLPESLSSLTTVIQNTVNDQVIRNLTVLNATLSIRAAAAAMQLGNALNQAISSSVR